MIIAALLLCLPQEPIAVTRMMEAASNEDWAAAWTEAQLVLAEHRDWLLAGEAEYEAWEALLYSDYIEHVPAVSMAELLHCTSAEYDPESGELEAEGLFGTSSLFSLERAFGDTASSVRMAGDFELTLQVDRLPGGRAPRVLIDTGELERLLWIRRKEWEVTGPLVILGARSTRFQSQPVGATWFSKEGMPLAPPVPVAHRGDEPAQFTIQRIMGAWTARSDAGLNLPGPTNLTMPARLYCQVADALAVDAVRFQLSGFASKVEMEAILERNRGQRYRNWCGNAKRTTGVSAEVWEAYLAENYMAGAGGRLVLSWRALPESEDGDLAKVSALVAEMVARSAENQLQECLELIDQAEAEAAIPSVWASYLRARTFLRLRRFAEAEQAAHVVLDVTDHGATRLILAELQWRAGAPADEWTANLVESVRSVGSKILPASTLLYSLRPPESIRSACGELANSIHAPFAGRRTLLPLWPLMHGGPAWQTMSTVHRAELSWQVAGESAPEAEWLLEMDAHWRALATVLGPAQRRGRILLFEDGWAQQAGIGIDWRRWGARKAGALPGLQLSSSSREALERGYPSPLMSELAGQFAAIRFGQAPSWFREGMMRAVADWDWSADTPQPILGRSVRVDARKDSTSLLRLLAEPVVFRLDEVNADPRSGLGAAFLTWLRLGAEDEAKQQAWDALIHTFGSDAHPFDGSRPEIDEEQIRAWEPEFRAWLDEPLQ